MAQNDKKRGFIELGKFLGQFSDKGSFQNPSVLYNDLFFEDFENLIQLSQSHNGWYTPENVYFSIQSWAIALTEENLNKWLSAYNFNEEKLLLIYYLCQKKTRKKMLQKTLSMKKEEN